MTTRAAQLHAYLAEVGARPFDWASWNCWTFTGRWLQQHTGIDVLQGLARTPSRHAAWRVLRSLGPSMADAWAQRSGLPAVPPALAQVGDVVLVTTLDAGGSGDTCMGLCAGRHAALVTPDDGIALMPMDWATHAWRVPA